MPRKLPDALRAPITDLASAQAWIKALVVADLSFHLEDNPGDIITIEDGKALFFKKDVPLLRERVASLYALDWGRKPGENFDHCPIGYMMDIELETGKREP